jgi:hypothetical protein
MANHCYARFLQVIKVATIKATFEAINREHFGNLLEITYYGSNSNLNGCTFRLSENTDLSASIWIKRGKEFEWKHEIDQFIWWIVSCLMSRFITAIDPNIKMTDDGISETLNPDFHIKYPKPVDWLIAIPSHYLDPDSLAALKQEFETVYSNYLPKLWSAVNSAKN